MLDPTRTSLGGAAAWFEVARDRGPTVGSLSVSSLSPGLEVNDLGFMSLAGKHAARGRVSRRWLQQRTFRRANVDVEGFWDQDWGGRIMARGLGTKLGIQVLDYTTVAGEAWRAFGGADRTALRGGPSLERKGNHFFRFDVRADPRRMVRWSVSLTDRPFEEGLARERRAAVMVGWRPSPAFDVELTPGFERNHQRQQYVETATVNGEPRYVVGWLQQETVQIGIRASFTFSPALSFQAYAQPLASTGQYVEFSEVVVPAARSVSERLRPFPDRVVQRSEDRLAIDMDQDGQPDLVTADPDFALLSLRSTLVLRWEFRRASTLSFVLQQNGSERSSDGGQDPLTELSRLGPLDKDVVGMLKVSYWLSK